MRYLKKKEDRSKNLPLWHSAQNGSAKIARLNIAGQCINRLDTKDWMFDGRDSNVLIVTKLPSQDTLVLQVVRTEWLFNKRDLILVFEILVKENKFGLQAIPCSNNAQVVRKIII